MAHRYFQTFKSMKANDLLYCIMRYKEKTLVFLLTELDTD